jgi:hypothetical protein
MNFRKLVIDNKDYKYFIGKSNVVIKDSEDKKTVVDFSKLTGLAWHEIERQQWKRCFSITPRTVTEYIKGNKL